MFPDQNTNESTTIDPRGNGGPLVPRSSITEKQQLSWPLDPNSKKIINLTVAENAPSVAMDNAWNNYFYHSSVFESLDRYFTIIPSTGTISINQDGLHTATKAAANDLDATALYIGRGTVMNLSKKTRFRTSIMLDNISQTEFAVVSNCSDPVGTNFAYIGFVILRGAIYGVTSDGTTENSVNLNQTVVVDTAITLEYRYTPDEQVVFYVNDVPVGTSRMNFPSESLSGDRNLFFSYLKTFNASSHSSQVLYWELMQAR